MEKAAFRGSIHCSQESNMVATRPIVPLIRFAKIKWGRHRPIYPHGKETEHTALRRHLLQAVFSDCNPLDTGVTGGG